MLIKCVLIVILIISSKYLLSKATLRSTTSQTQTQESMLTKPLQKPLVNKSMNLVPMKLKGTNTYPQVKLYHPHATEEMNKGLQSKLLNILRSETVGFDSCILLDFPLHENKGDSAISLGELNALHAINLTVENAYGQLWKGARGAQYKALKPDLNPEHTVILANGGGNIGAWPEADDLRADTMAAFKNFKYVILSQSVHFFNKAHEEKTKKQYATHGHVTVLLRDQNSFNFTQQHLEPVKPVQAPDMAFGIGSVHRYFQPLHDVIWINRADKENGIYCKPKFPDHVTYIVSDWVTFSSPTGKHIVDDMYIKTHNGLMFLQRARVVVTDRLHGYILSTLLDIPAVIIDNKLRKLSNFRNTWTAGKDHAVVAKDCQDAVAKAMDFLGKNKTVKVPAF